MAGECIDPNGGDKPEFGKLMQNKELRRWCINEVSASAH
jgi:hypothetical protein